MINKQEYLEKLFELTSNTVQKEICEICNEVGFNPDHYTIMIPTGGLSYTIEKIAQELYLSRRPIDDDIRQKLYLFNIVLETYIDSARFPLINDMIVREKKDSWGHGREIKRKDNIIAEVLKKVEQVYRNCYTCADSHNGCRGEDGDCCSPDYNDWRGGSNS